MTDHKEEPSDLRSLAEATLDAKSSDALEVSTMSAEEIRQVIHELRVHQIELEMQNEELRTAQVALEDSRSRYQDLYDYAPVGYVTLNDQGLLLEANLTTVRILGVERQRLTKMFFSQFVCPEFADAHYLHLRQVFETLSTQTCEIKLTRKDGTLFFAQLESVAVQDESGQFNRCRTMLSDITDRRKAEAALKISEEKYRTVVEESFDGVFVQNGTAITFANARLHEMLGYDRGELEGMDHWLVYHPDYHDITRSRAQSRLRGEAVPRRYEVNLIREDGASFPGEINAKVIRFDDEPGIQVWIRDLTEQKFLEKRLVEARKMEAIGTLAGGIAHDFNNLLHIISGHAELLDMELAERNLNFGELKAIRQAAHRGADLVKQILTFSRKIEAKFESINLNEEVRSTIGFLYCTIPKMIDIDTRLDEGLSRARADSNQIEQMLINLAVNAKDAMPDGGKLTIETRNVHVKDQYCRGCGGQFTGRYVLLQVSDTGHGMSDDVMQHIFEPFFTTKGLAEGTGLGLATVFGIVKMHGGHIACESRVGKGTTFNIYFPVTEAARRVPDLDSEAVPVAGGTETILVVDDEPMIRELAKRILEKSGYSVLTAAGGKEGIEVYLEHKSAVSLVILDLIMPEMGGKQCLEELLKIDPQVKALIAGGFAAKGDTKTFLDTAAKGILPKPFNMRELLRSVHHALDGS